MPTSTPTWRPPTVTAISPNSGPLGGGTSVTITGTGFVVERHGQVRRRRGDERDGRIGDVDHRCRSGRVGGHRGRHGDQPGRYLDDEHRRPVHVHGGSDGLVGQPGQRPDGRWDDGDDQRQRVRSGNTVKFGSTAASSVTVNSATSITAKAPAEAAGTVDVTVSNSGGTSATSSADQYTYVPVPTVTAVSPASGTTAGGTSVAITGTGFTSGTVVSFGSVAATSVTVNSRDLDHGSVAGAVGGDGRCDGDDGRRVVGHEQRRQVHLHRSGHGHGGQSHRRHDRRWYVGDDHRNRIRLG